MMRSLSALLNESKAAAMPKNFESSAVWIPLSSFSSFDHLPAASSHFPWAPSPSFQALLTHRLSQSSSNVSEKYTLPDTTAREPTHARVRNIALQKVMFA